MVEAFIEENLAAIVLILVVWVLPWKGYALWKAARVNDPYWFVALLVLNTVALLEIAYIFYFSERKRTHHKAVHRKK